MAKECGAAIYVKSLFKLLAYCEGRKRRSGAFRA
jgi:hypothetical protein